MLETRELCRRSFNRKKSEASFEKHSFLRLDQRGKQIDCVQMRGSSKSRSPHVRPLSSHTTELSTIAEAAATTIPDGNSLERILTLPRKGQPSESRTKSFQNFICSNLSIFISGLRRRSRSPRATQTPPLETGCVCEITLRAQLGSFRKQVYEDMIGLLHRRNFLPRFFTMSRTSVPYVEIASSCIFCETPTRLCDTTSARHVISAKH